MQNSGHFMLALTTSTPKRLSSNFNAGDPNASSPISWLSIQAEAGNVAVVYVGFSPSVLSSSNYAHIIPIPVTSIPAAPLIIAAPITSLDQVQVLGATDDAVTVGFIRS